MTFGSMIASEILIPPGPIYQRSCFVKNACYQLQFEQGQFTSIH
jgi:hypothetical protein